MSGGAMGLDEETIKRWLAAAPENVRRYYNDDRAIGEKFARDGLRAWAEEQVWCPHCAALYPRELCDGDTDLVTYWGDGDPVEKECGSCGESFFVQERVRRTYVTSKTEEEDDDA